MTSTSSALHGFIDAHAHLIHEQFTGEEDELAIQCQHAGLDHIVVRSHPLALFARFRGLDSDLLC
jgi:Tat protein secretion system quality control protein TatD with DNase activity